MCAYCQIQKIQKSRKEGKLPTRKAVGIFCFFFRPFPHVFFQSSHSCHVDHFASCFPSSNASIVLPLWLKVLRDLGSLCVTLFFVAVLWFTEPLLQHWALRVLRNTQLLVLCYSSQDKEGNLWRKKYCVRVLTTNSGSGVRKNTIFPLSDLFCTPSLISYTKYLFFFFLVCYEPLICSFVNHWFMYPYPIFLSERALFLLICRCSLFIRDINLCPSNRVSYLLPWFAFCFLTLQCLLHMVHSRHSKNVCRK